MLSQKLNLSRRTLVTGVSALAVGAVVGQMALTPSVSEAKTLRRTPSQPEGPFYPEAIPADNDWDLVKSGSAVYDKGQIALVGGVVYDIHGKPLPNAVVEIWQCDHKGNYHHSGDGNKAHKEFQGFGRVQVAADGRFQFRTIHPGTYVGRTPHIHVKVKLGRKTLLTTQFYIEGHPENAKDSIWRRLNTEERAVLTRPFVAKGQELHAQFELVVKT